MKTLSTPIILIILIVVSFSCKQKPVQSKAPEIIDPSLNIEKTGFERLFNGTGLDGWESTNFGPQGDVYVSGGQIVMSMGDGCTGITFKDSFPRINYEISLEAMKLSGTDFFCGMTFPVQDDFCSLIVGGWAGVVIGLSTIDGLGGSENETTSMMHFNKNEWYRIKLQVTGTSIKSWINEKQVIDFIHTGRDLNIRPEVSLSRPFGIATWKTTGAVRNIYLKRTQ